MTNKQIKLELLNYNVYIAQIKNIDLEIERIKNDYKGIKGQGFEDTGGGGTNAISRSVENEVMQKDARIAKLERAKVEAQCMIDRIDNAMKPLSDLEKKVIEGRYFKDRILYDVAEEMGYSYGWTKLTHTNALSKIALAFY